MDLGAAAWTFQEPRTQDWLTAEVPGCSHTDLLAHALIPDPFHGRNELDLQWIEERDWYYRCDFEIDVSLLGEDEIELVFEGLDTVATVLRNGEVILVSDNMFHRHRVPVKPWLRPGSNRLAFTFSSVINYLKTQRSDFKVEESNDRDQVLLRRRRLDGDALLSENTVFFAAPRMLDLRPS